MAKKKKNITGGEDTLYTVTKMAWKLYQDHLSRFTSYRAQYTAGVATAALQAAEDAAALPASEVRNGNLKMLRTILINAATDANNCWQDLYGYITHGFDEDQWGNMRAIAGGKLYRYAANEGWKSGESMLGMASKFIDTYSTGLLAGGMPAGFAADFEDKRAAFVAAVANYNDFKDAIGKEAAAKKTANIAVYNTLISMFRDAKKIFRKEPELKKSFSYTALAALVTKGGVTAFRISVKHELTGLPATTADIVLQPGNIKAFVDANGIAKVPVKAGKYLLTITTPGYENVQQEVTASPNVKRNIHITLKKVTATAVA